MSLESQSAAKSASAPVVADSGRRMNVQRLISVQC